MPFFSNIPINFSHVPQSSCSLSAPCPVRTYIWPSPPVLLLIRRTCVTQASVFAPVPPLRLLSNTVSVASMVWPLAALRMGRPSFALVRSPLMWNSPHSVYAFIWLCSVHVTSSTGFVLSSFVLSAADIIPARVDVAALSVVATVPPNVLARTTGTDDILGVPS